MKKEFRIVLHEATDNDDGIDVDFINPLRKDDRNGIFTRIERSDFMMEILENTTLNSG